MFYKWKQQTTTHLLDSSFNVATRILVVEMQVVDCLRMIYTNHLSFFSTKNLLQFAVISTVIKYAPKKVLESKKRGFESHTS